MIPLKNKWRHNMSDNDKYHLTLILLAIIVFSALGHYMGSRNDATISTNISNQVGEPDYINLANSGKGIPSEENSTKTSNKTNHTKNNTPTV
jgi:hypothetical protein